MKKKILGFTMAMVLGLSLVACGSGDGGSSTGGGSSTTDGGGSATVANKDKPLVWFNRQPSNSSTGELDKAALSYRIYRKEH